MKYKSIRVVFGVTMPNGQYNNDKATTYSVPEEVQLTDCNDYAARWKETVKADMTSYCRLTGATPVAIMAANVYYKSYQQETVY